MKPTFDAVIARLKSGREPIPARRPRVLIVDDEQAILNFVRRVLETEGYDVITAQSGTQAIELASAGEGFDVLVTDLVMPHMSGDELARRLRGAAPDLKVLYLTGFSDQLFREKVTLWDAEAFLEKPTSIEGLRQAVALLLYGSVNASVAAPRATVKAPAVA
jgi:two-component system cell cycle sensor histidine kinase/response regulator CckA